MTPEYLKKYQRWLNSDYVSVETKLELGEIANDIDEIERRFEKDLRLGTSGLRGVMWAGNNGMNIYTVRLVSQALANMILLEESNFGVVLAYDSRHNSEAFAKETASVMAANGITSSLFDDLRPTPELSFARRNLNTPAAVNITASHNTCEYNGNKVYW